MRWIPLMVAIPLGVAFAVPVLARRWRRAPDVLGNATMGLLALLAAAAAGKSGAAWVGGWGSLGIELRLDGLTALMLIAVNLVGLSAAIFSVDYMQRYTAKPYYYSLFLFMVAGMNGVVLTGDLFNLYVFMEVAAIASYALVAFGCEHEELEASFKYAVLGGVASGLILMGIAVLYGVTGNLNMARVAAELQAAPSRPAVFALALFICGFGLKAALVPFHAWLPDAHPSAPAPVSAMLSGVVIKALGIYVLCRLVFNVFGATPRLLFVIRMLGGVSMVAGVLLAIGQWDMKRLFAYHSISQIGYVALGLGLGSPLGIAGGLFHLFNHSVFKSLLFLNAGAVEYATGTRDLKKLGGLHAAMPTTANTSLVASLSIAGIPPFNGFWSKLLIVAACVQAGQYWLALAAVAVSLLTLASFLKVQRYAFFEALKSALPKAGEVPALMRAAMVLLAALCILTSLAVLGGWRSPLGIEAAVQALCGGLFGA
jgi:multicomponent Na+:H+ antiporter subunit D